MPEIPVNGVRLYYEEHGQGDPILCIHGTSSSAMVWRPAAIEDLSALGRVIVYDRRGCTRSERPDPYETSVVQHAEDAAALLLALDALPAVVIGRSYGGETAVELALRHPDRVRALVLLEAASLTLDDEAMAWAEELRAAVEEAASGAQFGQVAAPCTVHHVSIRPEGTPHHQVRRPQLLFLPRASGGRTGYGPRATLGPSCRVSVLEGSDRD